MKLGFFVIVMVMCVDGFEMGLICRGVRKGWDGVDFRVGFVYFRVSGSSCVMFFVLYSEE